MGKSRYVLGTLLATVAALAFLLIVLITPCGPGLSPDSLVYIGAARSFLEGNGFQSNGEVLTRFPPVYPFIIAVTEYLIGDIIQSARFLHAFLFAINVILIGLLARVVTKSNLAGALCSVLFVSCADMLDIHSMAWSEPLFISFSVSAYILIIVYVSNQRFSVLMSSGLSLGLALMTRYAGISLLPPMIIILLAYGSGPVLRRLRDSLVLFFIGVGPLVAWLTRNLIIAESATSRSIAFHPTSFRHLQILDKTISGFWFPESNLLWLKLIQAAIITSLLAFALIALLKTRTQAENQSSETVSPVHTLILLFCITYIVFLLFSISFLDATTPLDYRILSPFYAFSLVLVLSVYWHLRIKRNTPLVWKCFVVVSLAAMCLNAYRSASLISEWHKDGRWFAARQWKESECIAYARSLPGVTGIYSNEPYIINFLTGRNTRMLPMTVHATSNCFNQDFEEEMNAMRDEVMHSGAVVIYFDDISFRWYVPEKEKLQLPISAILKDGIIYATGINEKVAE